MYQFSRTSFSTTAILAAATLALAGCGQKASLGDVGSGEMSLGNANAKVTVIEYASVACPICAHVNETVMPQLRSKYIDTGKVRYVYRPMMTGAPSVAAAGHRLAECAGKDKYFKVVDAIMRAQPQMYANGENDSLARPVLLGIAQSVGLSEADFTKCVTDEKGLQRLNDLNEQYGTKDGITGTPTFVINGKKMDRIPQTIADFDEQLTPLLK